MMDGVNVLNTTIVPILTWGIHSVGGWVLVAFALVIVLLAISLALHYHESAMLLVFLIALIPIAFSLMFFSEAKQIGEYNVYDVYVDDGVDFNEFTTRYEILKQNGKLYTIRER